ncbi:MAG: LamG domain-containing protein [Bacteroidetes bacterium]|nr:MAG: LamG domain-containing protein [Bacteroidota bacterium]
MKTHHISQPNRPNESLFSLRLRKLKRALASGLTSAHFLYPRLLLQSVVGLLLFLGFFVTPSCKRKEVEPIETKIETKVYLTQVQRDSIRTLVKEVREQLEIRFITTKDVVKSFEDYIIILKMHDPILAKAIEDFMKTRDYLRIENLLNDYNTLLPASAKNLDDFVKPFEPLIDSASANLTPKELSYIKEINNELKIKGQQVHDKIVADTLLSADTVTIDVQEMEHTFSTVIAEKQKKVQEDASLSDAQKSNLLMYLEILEQQTSSLTTKIENAVDDLNLYRHDKGFGKKLKKVFKSVLKRVLPVVLAVGAGLLIGGGAAFLIKAALCTCIAQAIIAKLGASKLFGAAVGKLGINTVAGITKFAIAKGTQVQQWVQGRVYCKLVRYDCTDGQCNPKDFAGSVNRCLPPPAIVRLINKVNQFISDNKLPIGQINLGGWIDSKFTIENINAYKIKIDSLTANNPNIKFLEVLKGIELLPTQKIEIPVRVLGNLLGSFAGKVLIHTKERLFNGTSNVPIEHNVIDVSGLVIDSNPINPLNKDKVFHLAFPNGAGLDSVSRTVGIPVGVQAVPDKNGVANSAAHFNGDAFFNFGNRDINLGAQWSFSVWIKSPADFRDNFRMILSKGSKSTGAHYEFYIEPTWQGRPYTDGSLMMFMPALGIDTGTEMAVDDDTWKHIVIVCNSSKAMFYVNGVKVREQDYTGTVADSDELLLVGAQTDAPNGNFMFFKGDMDNLRLYTRILTEAEITHLYNTYQ